VKKTSGAERIWEIEFLRGLSIILMVGCHLLFDLGEFVDIPVRLPETFINVAGRHSLLIYIVHQPVIMGLLYVLGWMK